jgi:hypothetical protein
MITTILNIKIQIIQIKIFKLEINIKIIIIPILLRAIHIIIQQVIIRKITGKTIILV